MRVVSALFLTTALTGCIGPFAQDKKSHRHAPAPVAYQEVITTAPTHVAGLVYTDKKVSGRILEFQEGITSDQEFVLRGRMRNEILSNAMYLGGALRGGALIEDTNTDGKFPILSRFPNQHSSGSNSSDFIIQNAGLSFVGTGTNWLSVVGQLEYSQVFFRPEQDDFQLREIYALLGDLSLSPFYAAFGRKTVDFGEFDGFNPFTHTVNQHYFWAQTDDPLVEIGMIANGWRVSASAITSTRGLRVTKSDDEGKINNFAAKIRKAFSLPRGQALLSASYLHDTIYRDNFQTHTLGGGVGPPAPPPVPQERRTGAYDIAALYYTPRFDLGVEYTSTLEPWAATAFDPNTGLPLGGERNLQAITAQARFKGDLFGAPFAISGVYSQGIIGPENTEFDEAFQHALSFEYSVSQNIDLGLEYVYNDGFQPFVGVQGVSDTDVKSNALIIGLTGHF